jgi:hypothetical protein
MSESVFSANELAFREWHAAVLGAVVGAFAAYLHATEYAAVGVTIAVVFVVASLGVARYGSTASRTVRREPWYALAAFLAGGAVVLAVA